VQYRLRDWGISRQRYWGTPIPIVQCAKCGDVGVPKTSFRWCCPRTWCPDGSGSPLAKTPVVLRDEVPEMRRRGQARHRTPSTPSWTRRGTSCATPAPTRRRWWTSARSTGCPVDIYIGGIEHAILHLLYARFWTKAMRDLGPREGGRAVRELLTQGMVLNHIYSRRGDQGESNTSRRTSSTSGSMKMEGCRRKVRKQDGGRVDYEGIGTMSKSKRNGVDPQDMIERYGADTARFYVMQANPPTGHGAVVGRERRGLVQVPAPPLDDDPRARGRGLSCRATLTPASPRERENCRRS
jgi:leucyl-tRNA synthetase